METNKLTAPSFIFDPEGDVNILITLGGKLITGKVNSQAMRLASPGEQQGGSSKKKGSKVQSHEDGVEREGRIAKAGIVLAILVWLGLYGLVSAAYHTTTEDQRRKVEIQNKESKQEESKQEEVEQEENK
ncbi:hypothetical protein G7Y89_g4142 [Cudoniella acicularis]|uniref:Uncharacterized protein n=1 Tax=Cudoniella acicularis TaxID=354080 RepID=A0A8H4RQ11_9HELO|nr:hypothetical protein G7Y89_g4142 [Cudoniella acicularis]